MIAHLDHLVLTTRHRERASTSTRESWGCGSRRSAEAASPSGSGPEDQRARGGPGVRAEGRATHAGWTRPLFSGRRAPGHASGASRRRASRSRSAPCRVPGRPGRSGPSTSATLTATSWRSRSRLAGRGEGRRGGCDIPRETRLHIQRRQRGHRRLDRSRQHGRRHGGKLLRAGLPAGGLRRAPRHRAGLRRAGCARGGQPGGGRGDRGRDAHVAARSSGGRGGGSGLTASWRASVPAACGSTRPPAGRR